MLHAVRNEPLAADFYEGLKRYHNVDGAGNGGGVKGVQLPPGCKDVEQLDRDMRDLSDYLATQPSIKYLEAPKSPEARAASRKQIAQAARAEVSGSVKQNINAAIACIQNPMIAAVVRQAMDAAPAEFFTAPSSSTGKYHPADEINPGGLALHSLRDVRMGEMLCDYYGVEGLEKDEILGALLLHDIKKGGDPWNKYDKAHGPNGAKWLGEVWGEDHKCNASCNHMRELVGKHMAQWNFPEPSPPSDLANQIVSYADYLGSRDNVYVDVPK
ncbi:MAG: hypothetical protein FJX76_02820 [Armatimonadetes bacterium]|nr:hypothetical protein [Armatimonadota bacterium]